MARAVFSGVYGHNMQLEIVSGWNKPNEAENFSTVNVQVKLITNGYAAIYGPYNRTLSLNIDGVPDNIKVDVDISKSQTVLLISKDYRIPHNSDGTKSINMTASLDIDVGGYGSSSVSERLRLSDIPRASTGDAVNTIIGRPVTLTIDRKNEAFRHSIWVKYGNYDKKIAGDNVETSYTWTPEMALCEQTPDAVSGFGTITYITYNNGVEVGRDIRRVNLTVPDNVKPTLADFSITDTNTTVSQLLKPNHFIRVLSDIKVSFGQAIGAYGSTIVGFHAEIVGRPYSVKKNGGTFGNVDFAGQAIIRAAVTDSRGRTSAPKELTVNVLDYHLPQISFDVRRVGTNADLLQVTRNAKIAPLTVDGAQKNVMKLRFKVSLLGTNKFTEDTGPARGDFTTIASLINSAANLGNKYPADKSFVVIGTVEDLFTSTSYRFEVPTRSVVRTEDQYGIGVMKVRERGALDVGGDIYANNKPIQQHQLTQNNGKAIRLDRDFDLNNVVVTGLYMGNNLKNTPQKSGMHEWVYVRVTQHDDKYSLQELVDFNGVVSAYRVRASNIWKPWQTVITEAALEKFQKGVTREIPMPHGLSASLARSGNLVTISLNRRISNIPKYENVIMNETIPIGFRPMQDISMVVTANTNTNVWGTAILHFLKNGGIALTNGITQTSVWLGTVSYITRDPYP